MLGRLRRFLPVLLTALLFSAGLEVLRVELRVVTWPQLMSDLTSMAPSRLALALGLTALNYLLLTGYDFLAFRALGRSLSRTRIAGAALLAYAISNNVGFAAVSGASVRYRFYSRWGVTWEELSRLIVSYSTTFWLGLFALGGVSLATASLPLPPGGSLAALAPVLGWLLLAVTAAFLIAAMIRTAPIRIGRIAITLPSAPLALAQLALSSAEWLLASAVLFVLLPPSELTLAAFVPAFLAAMLLGMASHVPGGVGVFDGLLVVFLRPYLSSGQLLPALVAYRTVYYLIPLSIALPVLVADEVRARRSQAARVTAFIGRLADGLTPRLLSTFTFLAGLVLLLSGATPAAPGRIARLSELIPFGLIEASHFIGSVAGALLLIVSQGLARRLDAAYYSAAAAILVGIAASLLKGLDYEEAIGLTLVLLVLWRARPAFDCRAAFFETRFSAEWVAAVICAVVASVWLGRFAFKHVDYSNELWWQFARQADASRSLRASVGAAVVVLLFGAARLLRPAPHEVEPPTDDDLAAAGRIIATQGFTYANLIYLRDKGLLFNADRTGFVMYSVQGRSFVALGDPVGPPHVIAELVRLFLERCDDFGATPVFYEVSRHYLHHYADFGMTFVKLGEEARVDLTTFALAVSRGARIRQAIRRLEKDGGRFRIVPAAEVSGMLPALRRVSDDWLREKSAAEKGFSLGFFDEVYLARFPVAVIERDGEVVAFANLWMAADHNEASVDLMRYHRDAPKGVMEALLSNVMVHCHEQGFRWFALGMAPLSGFEQSPVAPLWNRLGALLYEHGERVYNFQGLRAYKEKFNPVWEPHYLACSGGLRVPRVLADVSALVAGGYRRIFLK